MRGFVVMMCILGLMYPVLSSSSSPVKWSSGQYKYINYIPFSDDEYSEITQGIVCNEPNEYLTFAINPRKNKTILGCFEKANVSGGKCLELNFKNGKTIIQPSVDIPCKNFNFTPCAFVYNSVQSYRHSECFINYGGIPSVVKLSQKLDTKNSEFENAKKENNEFKIFLGVVGTIAGILAGILLIYFIVYTIPKVKRKSQINTKTYKLEEGQAGHYSRVNTDPGSEQSVKSPGKHVGITPRNDFSPESPDSNTPENPDSNAPENPDSNAPENPDSNARPGSPDSNAPSCGFPCIKIHASQSISQLRNHQEAKGIKKPNRLSPNTITRKIDSTSENTASDVVLDIGEKDSKPDDLREIVLYDEHLF